MQKNSETTACTVTQLSKKADKFTEFIDKATGHADMLSTVKFVLSITNKNDM